MKVCPNCGSTDIDVISENGVKGYGFCKGFLGLLCLGPFGILCGFLGFGKPKTYKQYTHCNSCGRNSNVWF